LLIIFDLDGTLIDSAQDLAISMNATRAHFNLPPLDPSLIYSYVGNGAPVLVNRAMGEGNSPAVLDDALAFFLRFYRGHALEHTRFYPGVREAVEQLARRGHILTVLTNKPVRISRDILAALGVAPLFRHVYGGDSFAAKKPDPIGVTTLLSDAQISAANSVLVGDSGVDVQTARNAGIRSCGVAWGFQPEAFLEYPPDVVVRDPDELVRTLEDGQTKGETIRL
jgi:phosphoglycolate phosphatase